MQQKKEYRMFIIAQIFFATTIMYLCLQLPNQKLFFHEMSLSYILFISFLALISTFESQFIITRVFTTVLVFNSRVSQKKCLTWVINIFIFLFVNGCIVASIAVNKGITLFTLGIIMIFLSIGLCIGNIRIFNHRKRHKE